MAALSVIARKEAMAMTKANSLDPSEVALLPRRPMLDPDRDEEEVFEELVQAFRAELDELDAFNPDAGEWTYSVDEFVGEDEFTCRGCNLILHRSLLRDEEHTLCDGCSAEFRTQGRR